MNFNLFKHGLFEVREENNSFGEYLIWGSEIFRMSGVNCGMRMIIAIYCEVKSLDNSGLAEVATGTRGTHTTT